MPSLSQQVLCDSTGDSCDQQIKRSTKSTNLLTDFDGSTTNGGAEKNSRNPQGGIASKVLAGISEYKKSRGARFQQRCRPRFSQDAIPAQNHDTTAASALEQ